MITNSQNLCILTVVIRNLKALKKTVFPKTELDGNTAPNLRHLRPQIKALGTEYQLDKLQHLFKNFMSINRSQTKLGETQTKSFGLDYHLAKLARILKYYLNI